jgi:hypothetical protein
MGWQGKNPGQWVAETKGKSLGAIKRFTFEVFKQCVEKSPVDTGQFRGAWGISMGQDDQSHKGAPDKSDKGHYTVARETAKLDSVDGDGNIFIMNNMPYGKKIEFGTFTKKPETDKTIGGYSKQSPQGVVGVTLANVDRIWEDAVKSVKDNP